MKPIANVDSLDAHALQLYRWGLAMQQDVARLVAAAEQLTRAAAARGLDLTTAAAAELRSAGRTLSEPASRHIAVATNSPAKRPTGRSASVARSGQPRRRTPSQTARPQPIDVDAVNRLLLDASRSRP